MTKSWRPEGWENPYFDEDAGGIKRPDDGYEEYEEGADAMLEALRQLGNSRGGRVDNLDRKGTWIFLSDVEDSWIFLSDVEDSLR